MDRMGTYGRVRQYSFRLDMLPNMGHVRASIRTPILTSLLRDGTLCFGVVLAVECFNVTAFITLKAPLSMIGVHLTYSLPSMMASRCDISGSHSEAPLDGIDDQCPSLDHTLQE